MYKGWCSFEEGKTQEFAWVWGNFEWKGYKWNHPTGMYDWIWGDVYFYRL